MMPFFEPKITKREHDEIVAQLRAAAELATSAAAAEISKLIGERDAARFRADANARSEVQTAFLAANRRKEIVRLQAKLAVFTAPRTRGPGGRFLPTRPVGEMGEGGL